MNTKNSPRLCLVEDDAIMGESLVDRFRLEGFAIDWHRHAAQAHRAIGQTRYAAVISDVRLPDASGEVLFARLAEEVPQLPPFVFITGYGTIERAVALLKAGASDYVTKPFDLDDLVMKVRQLCRNREASGIVLDGGSLGLSPAMLKIEATLKRAAKHAGSVLITGESGVGKERVARYLHALASAGEPQPFVPVNCGAITESLIEAELFGHERGAFTGAVKQRKGVFEQADGGTLFLDEIGDMPLQMQVKLLRAIQERSIVRVGAERAIAVECRLVCATNQNLKARVEAGNFREDLYYRINVIHLHVPLLRERPEDILWFARQFLREFAQTHDGLQRSFAPEAERALIAYPWPGNLRELRHCIERACILCGDAVLGPDALFDSVAGAAPPTGSSLEHYIRECERAYIEQALQRCHGHIAHTAAHLGITRKNLWEKMKRLQIQGRA